MCCCDRFMVKYYAPHSSHFPLISLAVPLLSVSSSPSLTCQVRMAKSSDLRPGVLKTRSSVGQLQSRRGSWMHSPRKSLTLESGKEWDPEVLGGSIWRMCLTTRCIQASEPSEKTERVPPSLPQISSLLLPGAHRVLTWRIPHHTVHALIETSPFVPVYEP